MLKYSQPGELPVDRVFGALGDATRRSMVARLCEGPASVSELAAPLHISLPAVMQHLHVLEDSGLVRSEKIGRVRTCTVQPAAMQAAERWIAERRAFWEESLDRLGELLAEDADTATAAQTTARKKGSQE